MDEVKKPLTPVDHTAEIIEKAISKTLEAVLPLLQAYGNSQPQQQQVQQPIEQILSSSDVRRQISINTMSAFDKELAENQKFIEGLANSPESDYVMFTIPRIYQKYFGSTLPASVNGSIINIPIDNKPHRLHKLYVASARARIDYEDEKVSFMSRNGGRDYTLVDRNTLGQ
jgi:hypothetical protein